MNYNEKFEKLIKDAKKDGYTFLNGEFHPVDKKIPVIEILYIYNYPNENHSYGIYKKTCQISKYDYEKVFTYAKENNYKEITMSSRCSNNKDFIEEMIENIISKYDDSQLEYVDTSSTGTITVQHRKVGYHENEQYIVNLIFNKEYDEDNFPKGIISFYYMKAKDLKNVDNIDLYLKSFNG